MPDTLLEYCHSNLLPFPTQIDTILLTSITIDNSSQVAKVGKAHANNRNNPDHHHRESLQLCPGETVEIVFRF